MSLLVLDGFGSFGVDCWLQVKKHRGKVFTFVLFSVNLFALFMAAKNSKSKHFVLRIGSSNVCFGKATNGLLKTLHSLSFSEF